MHTVSVFQWFNRHKQVINYSAAPMLVLLTIAVGLLVYYTGGIKYVYSHSMYVPIVLSGMIYGVTGGVTIALIGGLILGPNMPLDIVTGEMQPTVNWLYRTGFFVLLGSLSGAVSATVRNYIRHLHWVSRHDVATQLPNRLALMDDLSLIPRRKRSAVQNRILLVLSVNSTVELKAAFGHEVIESIITQTAHRFNHILINRGQVYRADTEEVSALIELIDIQDMNEILLDLNRTSRLPYQFEGIPVHVDSRMGYVTITDVHSNPGLYLQQAEAALSAANDSLLEFVEYQPSIKLATRENVSLLGELMRAIEQNQLKLHYQPKIDIHSGKLLGVEALLRWTHPSRGNIPPGTFIPCAERSSLIHPLTEFVLTQTMHTALHFQEQSISVPIAVNISAHNLCQPDFAENIFKLLAEFGLEGTVLELELTESALIKDMNHTIHELTKLADAGIQIAVDDFGTGYSSLQYLHRLPITHLKIDQSFVRRLPRGQDAIHIIEAAVSLAHKIDLTTIAEGVENAAVMQFLGDIGCDMAQGFYISRPVPENDFIDWYKQHQGAINWQH
ncbi:putative bifunctional diguanylate cyclase/phosphodiesterase [Methylophaga sp. OBS1]|uniref:putative bifunctional diguanylate cyclase/phosphodiesterase n=1 Tax=Methylophaga sp. OBS1 TaxID=2991933 RepID=UPI0022550589|nr:bifunctional diguanylate cyclase/phosphodiesterase [Methylophaga sp. OBS1]MCX4191287.1 bifunctional diguanylate cyclase/phosphodiesterase [Methylophaga sp. OBS1]MCX4191767.1 bifunctional diguanylate cyclase/phosphodiesterase [Methylophaga sp. OBS1]